MYHLFLDTCVWIDLAVNQDSLIPKLFKLIEDSKVRIVVPELVKQEWDSNKKKIISQITKKIVDAQRSSITYLSFIEKSEYEDFRAFISSANPQTMGKNLAEDRIQRIESIINSESSLRIPISDSGKVIAIEHALQKKAPFHMKNSMADALIFFTIVEWVNNNNPDKSIFVTLNTRDFSDKKKSDTDTSYFERISPDLQQYVEENGLEFAPYFAKVISEIERFLITDEEIRISESVVKQIRELDDYLGILMSSSGMKEYLKQQEEMKELMSSSGMKEYLKQQAEMKELMSMIDMTGLPSIKGFNK